MDQRKLVKQLEDHFRKEEQAHLDHRKRVHEVRGSQTDEEWWDELIERTRRIRPQMLAIFDKNKEEMISKRFHTISSEEGFREKQIQKRVMELLPYISAVRSERAEEGDLTKDQLHIAKMRLVGETSKASVVQFEKQIEKESDPFKREILKKFVLNANQDLIDLKTLEDPQN